MALPLVNPRLRLLMENQNMESILNHRGKGKTWKYLIKWKGYDLSDATWEPEDNVHAPLLVKAYFSQNNQQRKEIKA
jgi:hypothetical protein